MFIHRRRHVVGYDDTARMHESCNLFAFLLRHGNGLRQEQDFVAAFDEFAVFYLLVGYKIVL